jgi:L-asparaginase
MQMHPESGHSYGGPERKSNTPTFGVLMMGGTLAMEKNEHGRLVPAKNLSSLLSRVNLPSGEYNLPTDLQQEVVNIDSTNMNQRHWERAISRLEKMQDQCDGILIPHGTDTMAYTASALGLAARLKVPVVLTGAQLPIDESGSDAPTNLERSLQTLKKAVQDGAAESMVFFDKEAFRGLTSFKVNEADIHAFDTASTPAIYNFNAWGVNRNGSPITAEQAARNRYEVREVLSHEIEPNFSHELIGLELKPGITAEGLKHIAGFPGYRAIILKSFGAGNVPSSENSEDILFNLIPAIFEITYNLGKPVIITSPFRGGNTNTGVYESGDRAVKAGAIDAGRMTDEAAYVKASLLLGQKHFSPDSFVKDYATRMDEFEELFRMDFAGETSKGFDFTPKGQ